MSNGGGGGSHNVDFQEAGRKRDRRLRRALLEALVICGPKFPTGQVPGRYLVDCACEGFDDDAHALAVCESMVIKGHFEKQVRDLRRGERFGLENVVYRLTAAGLSLHEQTGPIDPDVDDERIDPSTL